ncbi:hypothetical protein OSB04_000503 [Centaurea solstitialis]|uniref:Uncharacterized protein n=1 Tax=Centaurea solstitialis TaxID=347529 RepID=A0AA38U7I9_9ASTR|nr:hypothetical protein OSB04_000503 [Centaurea solstitialis]
MARTKSTLAIFILVLTISFNIRCVEGRHLKHRTDPKNTFVKEARPYKPSIFRTEVTSRHGAKYANKALLTKPIVQTPSLRLQTKTRIEPRLQPPPPPPPSPRGAEDFRPTAPGHSPGVGHSVQN